MVKTHVICQPFELLSSIQIPIELQFQICANFSPKSRLLFEIQIPNLHHSATGHTFNIWIPFSQLLTKHDIFKVLAFAVGEGPDKK